MIASGYLDPNGCPNDRPKRSAMSACTQKLHDGIDATIRATQVAYVHPEGPSVQTDLFGGSQMTAWQTQKASWAMLGEGSWAGMAQIYSRYGTESGRALMERLCTLESAEGVVLADSGMQAIATLLDAILEPGDHVLVSRQIYNKSRAYIDWLSHRMHIEPQLFDEIDPIALGSMVQPNTRALFVETYSNPLMRALDPKTMSQWVESMREGVAPRLRLIVDHTVATPWGLRKPLLTWPGVDAVVASGTKGLSGQDRDMWGYIASRRLPLLNAAMNMQAMRGGGLSWRVAQAAEQALPVAETTFARRCETAVRIALFLDRHRCVSDVFHPSLKSHPDHHLVAEHYCQTGSLISFRIKGANEADMGHFCDVLATTGIIRYALSFDGLASKINHHKTVSEFHTPDAVLRRQNMDRLARLGVGVENSDDLMACLNWALCHFQNISKEAVASWQQERRTSLGLVHPPI